MIILYTKQSVHRPGLEFIQIWVQALSTKLHMETEAYDQGYGYTWGYGRRSRGDIEGVSQTVIGHHLISCPRLPFQPLLS